MYLTEIADSIATGLTNSLPDNWGGIVIPTDMPVIVDFDPIVEGGDLDLDIGIYITPSFSEYDLGRSRPNDVENLNTGLRGRQGVSKTSYITVSICRPYTRKLVVTPVIGVQSEWSLLRNLQDDLEQFLIRFSIAGVKLETIESDPPDAASLHERVYLALITLGYKSC